MVILTILIIVGLVLYFRKKESEDEAPVEKKEYDWHQFWDDFSGTERRNEDFYNKDEYNFQVSYHYKEMTKLEKVANLYLGEGHLATLEYNNGMLTARMTDGNYISAHLKDIEAYFTIQPGENVSCVLKTKNRSITIFSFKGIFTDEEWYEIFNIMTHCGITHNAGAYVALCNRNKTKIGQTVKYANTAIKIIRALS